MRTIMLSAAYQRSAEARPGNEKDDRFYSRYLTRRLPAEVILDAFSQVTGVPEDFGGYPPRDPRDAAARHACGFLLPERLRPSRARPPRRRPSGMRVRRCRRRCTRSTARR